MILVGLLIEIIKNVFPILCWICVFAWLPATLGFFGFFNVFKKRYLIAASCYLGYFIVASFSLAIVFGIMTPPWDSQNPTLYEDFGRGVTMGLYICAALATINCVVFAFALKKKLAPAEGGF